MSGCIFCGTTPTTNAHVFRKAWIDKVFPGSGQYQHRHVRRGPGGFDSQWSKDETDIKANCACESCNSGWMDKLDHAAEDLFLTHAVTGYPVKLSSQADIRLLARWTALIAVLSDQTQARPVLDTATQHAVREGEVPEGMWAWLFRTEPPPQEIHVRVEPRTLLMESGSIDPVEAYFVTFGVGHLVAQALVPPKGTPEGIEFDRSTNLPLLRQLWPPTLMPLIWPPPQTVPFDQLPELAGAFQADSPKASP